LFRFHFYTQLCCLVTNSLGLNGVIGNDINNDNNSNEVWLASTYHNRLQILGFHHPLECRRAFCDILLYYRPKIMDGLLDTEIADVLSVAANSKIRGHFMKLIKTVLLMQANIIFSNRVVNVWKSLSSHILSVAYLQCHLRLLQFKLSV